MELAEMLRDTGLSSLAAYVLVLSVIGFVLMGRDKRLAGTGGWRIPEKTLLMIALIGGSPGVYLGMRAFRHKTKHALFSVGVPAILGVHAVLFFWLYAG